ncbi:hypothetical protein FKM82_023725 [Ascaphus truei]
MARQGLNRPEACAFISSFLGCAWEQSRSLGCRVQRRFLRHRHNVGPGNVPIFPGPPHGSVISRVTPRAALTQRENGTSVVTTCPRGVLLTWHTHGGEDTANPGVTPPPTAPVTWASAG